MRPIQANEDRSKTVSLGFRSVNEILIAAAKKKHKSGKLSISYCGLNQIDTGWNIIIPITPDTTVSNDMSLINFSFLGHYIKRK